MTGFPKSFEPGRVGTVLLHDQSLVLHEQENGIDIYRRRQEVARTLLSEFAPDILGAVRYGNRSYSATADELLSLRPINYEYGSNLADGLTEALRVCQRTGARRIILSITTLPSAHRDETGSVQFSWPPATDTVLATEKSMLACVTASITIDVLAIGTPNEEGSKSVKDFGLYTAQTSRGTCVNIGSEETAREAVHRLQAQLRCE